MVENLENLSDIVDIPTDNITKEVAQKYNGTKVKITKVYPGLKKTAYQNNVKLPDGQTIEVPVVYIETDVFGIDAKGQPLLKKTSFNLQKLNGKLGFSTSPKTKARKFMKMLKINRIEESVGRDVVIVSTSKNDRFDLVMSIPD